MMAQTEKLVRQFLRIGRIKGNVFQKYQQRREGGNNNTLVATYGKVIRRSHQETSLVSIEVL